MQKSKMSFPKSLIENTVLVKSMPYGCPTEPFGHDKIKKGSFAIASKGQITIPREIRKSMNIKEGDTLLLIDIDELYLTFDRLEMALKQGQEQEIKMLLNELVPEYMPMYMAVQSAPASPLFRPFESTIH